MTWFQRFATPKKKGEEGYLGMQPVIVCGELMKEVRQSGVDNSNFGEADLIKGQMLPEFKEDASDYLYGYDAFLDDRNKKSVNFNNKVERAYPVIEQFDESRHITGQEKSGGNTSQNRKSRQEGKNQRG
jgi:hypothetical protein